MLVNETYEGRNINSVTESQKKSKRIFRMSCKNLVFDNSRKKFYMF